MRVNGVREKLGERRGVGWGVGCDLKGWETFSANSNTILNIFD
jgi:hypothetical protein